MAEEAIFTIWKEQYKGKYAAPSKPSQATRQAPVRSADEEEWSNLDEYLYIDYTDIGDVDALDEYLKGFPTQGSDPIAFAQEIEFSKPDLAAMIYDMAAIPAMSAECERIFSSAKILLNDHRARMKPILIEAYECLRHWLLPASTADQQLQRDPPIYDRDAVAKEAQEAQQDKEDDAVSTTDIEGSDPEDDDSDSGDSGFTGSYTVLSD